MGWMIVVWWTICDQGGPVMASQMVCGDMYGSHILLGTTHGKKNYHGDGLPGDQPWGVHL